MADEDKYVQEELRLYISSLEDQLRNIQNDCLMHFFQQGRFALFTEQQRDKYLQSKNLLAAKQCEGLKSKEKFKEGLKRFKQGLHCIGHDHKDMVKQGMESIVEISTRLADRMSQDKIVQDRGRMLSEQIFFNELSKRDAVNNELYGNNKRHSFEKMVIENATKYQDAMYNFSTIKQGILSDIWNLEKSSESDVEIEKLQNYFHELNQEVKRALDKRRDEIERLKREQESLTSELHTSLRRKAKLKKQKTQKTHFAVARQIESGSSSFPSEQHGDDDVENLKLFNYELTKRLETAQVENKDLKKQFWSAYRKILQVAEFKAYVLEEILRLRQSKDKAM